MAMSESSISHRLQAGGVCPTSQEGSVKEKAISQPKRSWLFLKVKDLLFGSQVFQKLEQTPCYFSEKT